MIGYGAVLHRLGQMRTLAGMAAAYRELVGPLPETSSVFELSPPMMAQGILDKVSFPTHDGYLDDVTAGGYEFEVAYRPLWEAVCFQGLDAEQLFEDWPDSMKVVLALFEIRAGADSYNAYSQEAQAWWAEQAARFDLPGLDELDWAEVMERLDGLPAPFHGLHAAFQWAAGDTGYHFADIPCAYVHEMDLGDFGWTPETIRMLERDWQEARAVIFDPAWELEDLCRKNEQALGVCMRLAVGYEVAWLYRDGELMVME